MLHPMHNYSYQTSTEGEGVVAYVRADLYEEAIAALRACEENLRLVHEAAGPLERGAPMPSHCTFDAWRLADEVIRRHEERATLAPTTEDAR